MDLFGTDISVDSVVTGAYGVVAHEVVNGKGRIFGK